MEKNCQNILSDKYVFIAPSDSDFECLQQCLSNRLEAGQGECFVVLGVGESQEPGLSASDMSASEATLQSLAQLLDVHLVLLRTRTVPAHSSTDASTAAAAAPPGAKSKKRSRGRAGRASKENAANTNVDGKVSKKVTPTPITDVATATAAQTAPQTATASDSQTVVAGTTPQAASASSTGGEWIVKDFLLRHAIGERDFIDIRVAVVGNVDAGKSTMLGVLTHGELDNGRGLARQYLFRHKHEIESGRTSSVGNNILGFDADGKVVNRAVHGKLDWVEICQAATKVVTFIDLAGHERYLKTTVFGLVGFAPDFVMLMVGANAGVIGMTKEHLGLALALSVPVFVVVTKIDMCPPNVLNETLNHLFHVLKSPGCRKIPLLVSNHDDVVCSATNFTSERMCPVFLVSNVTGANLDLLTAFLNLLSTPSPTVTTSTATTTPSNSIAASIGATAVNSTYRLDRPASFQIDELFTVPGVGAIVSGTCMSGVVRLNETLSLGPDTSGRFFPVVIKSIQRKRLPVNSVRAGQTASFSLKRPKGCTQLRRGMMLLGKGSDLTSCMNFTATVLVLHHPTTISVGYQAMVHTGPIRQTATILSIGAGTGKERLRTGDKAEVHFAFINHPECLHKGARLIFREGKTKAVGTVNQIVPYQPVLAPVTGGRSRRAQKAPSRQPTAPPISTEKAEKK
ncbi:GTP-binding protein 1 [Taenia solium]|eukprot:TsM_000481300 transcript=TsM_000481300 gene=TsM_000481300